MEELFTLKDLLTKGDIPGALVVVEELEEMSRDDKISNITSYGVILLMYLIKQQAANPTTRSWEVSIENSAWEIQKKNKRRKTGGYYFTPEELRQTLLEAYPKAIKKAALEGAYDAATLENMLDREDIIDRALQAIAAESESQ